MNLKGKNFLKLLDVTSQDMIDLMDLAVELKAKKKAGILHDVCRGKNIALIFEKTSTSQGINLLLNILRCLYYITKFRHCQYIFIQIWFIYKKREWRYTFWVNPHSHHHYYSSSSLSDCTSIANRAPSLKAYSKIASSA